jgi:hypothetical protein
MAEDQTEHDVDGFVFRNPGLVLMTVPKPGDINSLNPQPLPPRWTQVSFSHLSVSPGEANGIIIVGG